MRSLLHDRATCLAIGGKDAVGMRVVSIKIPRIPNDRCEIPLDQPQKSAIPIGPQQTNRGSNFKFLMSRSSLWRLS